MNKKFDIEPAYGDRDKYINTKIKSYRDKVDPNFKVKITKRKYMTNVCD